MKKALSYNLSDSVKLLKAVADPVRLRLINLLIGGERCVCDLYEILDIPQSTVSRHLAYLKKHGLIMGRREGTWIYYSLTKRTIRFHRKLSECVEVCFNDLNVFKRDRQKLGRRSCC